jgi:penicillin-binding protein 1C
MIRRRRKLVRLLAGAAAVTAAGLIMLAVATLRALEPIPPTLEVVPADAVRYRFVDRNGVPLNATYDTDWNVHDRVPLHEIPRFLREAFIHAEDKRFYSHHGADWIARLAALATNLRHADSIRGASTITEQVVRMLHQRPRTVWTRWLEGFEAGRLERRFSKDEILTFYLNQVPYASRRRGVRQAAELYFARDLETLSDREMLALAVLVRSPSRLDLREGLSSSADAIERLADAMRRRHVIGDERHAAILAEDIDLRPSSLAVSAPHFLRFAAAETGRRPATVTVATTLDAGLQAQIQGLLDTRIAALQDLAAAQGGVLVADNATGEVLAWVVAGGGGESGPVTFIDPITTPRQPGSALKPFLYALAIERGGSLADIVVDAPLAEDVGDGLHRYRNYSNRHYGPVTLRDALANSLNVPAVKLLHGIGPETYLEHLHRFGFASLREHPDVYGDGLALGDGEVTVFELVRAYLALANRGGTLPLRVLRDGVPDEPSRRVVSPETASLIADALADTDARAAEFGRDSVLSLPVQTAVKTGTSSDYRDAWAVGFDARFTVGIWIGNLDQSPMNGVTGSIGPALLLRSVFSLLNRRGNTAPLYLSPKLTQREVCVPSPRAVAAHCLTRREWFDPSHRSEARVGESETRFASIRLRQPIDGLELAYDPRIPAESQAFEFMLDAVDADDHVRWRIDGDTEDATGERFVWPVTRGPHEVGATISRNGVVIADLSPVEFVVR